jgi:hypothetical protein
VSARHRAKTAEALNELVGEDGCRPHASFVGANLTESAIEGNGALARAAERARAALKAD